MTVYYQDELVTLYHGDCLDVLSELPDESVDAVVTDPPYGLANTTPEQVTDTLIRWVNGDREYLPGGSPKKGASNCLTNIVRRAESDMVDLDPHASEQFVKLPVTLGASAAAMLGAIQFDHDATLREEEVHDEAAPLVLADMLVDDLLTGRSQVGEQVEFRLRATKSGAPCVGECSCFGELTQRLVTVGVRLGYYSQTEAQRSSGIVALRATELRAVLSLDVASGALKLTVADSAPKGDGLLLVVTPKPVGALAPAGRLSTMTETSLVGDVNGATGRALAVDLLAHVNLRDRIFRPNNTPVGFMGHEWDGFVPPVAVWDECMRVLKPGGHVLAFAGTRTMDLMGLGLRLAGFDIRDSVAWLYGSGFPKSLDVSKAIDKAAGADREVVGTKVGLPGYSLAEDKGRGVYNPSGMDSSVECVITAPATDEAAQWDGWGTALKPAFEPVILARKPLRGTVAANVLAHGTGALNIDATRIDMGAEYDPNAVQRQSSSTAGMRGLGGSGFASDHTQAKFNAKGRWPANVVLDESQAEQLDQQSGTLKSGVLAAHHKRAPKDAGILGAYGSAEGERGYGDQGGASRFFYVSKASKAERPVIDGTAHPTVKPLTLLKWLVRLVTPPGGTVLDPFAGSGTTLEAAGLEGFSCIGIEREADYLPLIRHRIDRAAKSRSEEAAAKEAQLDLFGDTA